MPVAPLSYSRCPTALYRDHSVSIFRKERMRLPLLWLSFWLLFAFWLTAFFFHLHGGLTTYALLVVG
jgi:hypothetical protein